MKQSTNHSSFGQTMLKKIKRFTRWLVLRIILLLLGYFLLLRPLIDTGIEAVNSSSKQIETTTEWVGEQLEKISGFFQPYNHKSPKFPKFPSYEVHTTYFIDDSPPGAYDFTLKLNNEFIVPIPAPCTGIIRRVWFQGKNGGLERGKGAGQIVELSCDSTDYYWLMAHLIEGSPPKKGTRIIKGQAIGLQGVTGRTSGYHIHAQIHRQNGKRIANRKFTRPLVKKYIRFLRRGNQ